jgi:D-arabinose 1-dehydrogenase-like Zn-dependent alcohol dehydrogenase
MFHANSLRRCHMTLDQVSSLIAVVEMSQSSWLVAGIVPGISRQPARKLKPDQTALLGLLRRWQDEAAKAGRRISGLAVAFEAGRAGGPWNRSLHRMVEEAIAAGAKALVRGALQDVNVPDLKPGQVLVEVRASAINPSDVKDVAGGFNASMPRVPGRDYAGIVVAGDGWIGKKVWGSGAGFGVTRDGTHSVFLVVQSDWLSEKPSRLSVEEAAAVGVPYLAAWSALAEAADIQGGETVLITGVSGAVGRAATQIAHWNGAKVIGAEISDKPSDADMFINAKGKHLPTEIQGLTDGKGVDLVLDAVGGPMFEPALKSLRLGGRQVVMAVPFLLQARDRTPR